MKLSEKLQHRLENELGLEIQGTLWRIYGAKGAAHRWGFRTTSLEEFTSEDTMRNCVKSKTLHILKTSCVII